MLGRRPPKGTEPIKQPPAPPKFGPSQKAVSSTKEGIITGAKRKMTDFYGIISNKRRILDEDERKDSAPNKKRRVSEPMFKLPADSETSLLPKSVKDESEHAADTFLLSNGTGRVQNIGQKKVKKEENAKGRRKTIGGGGVEGLKEYKGWAWVEDDDATGRVLEKDRPIETEQCGGRPMRKRKH